MDEYDVNGISNETAVIVVTSTFGNGEPPTNAVHLHKQLLQLEMNKKSATIDPESFRYSGMSRKSN